MHKLFEMIFQLYQYLKLCFECKKLTSISKISRYRLKLSYWLYFSLSNYEEVIKHFIPIPHLYSSISIHLKALSFLRSRNTIVSIDFKTFNQDSLSNWQYVCKVLLSAIDVLESP